MKYFLTEEFIDELAKRVAQKIAQKHYRNKLFNETRKPYTHVYESGCGNHDAFPTSNNNRVSCGSYVYDGGCGSSNSFRQTYNGGCGSNDSFRQTYNGGCGSSPRRTGGC